MSKKKGGKDMKLLDEISVLQTKISDIDQQLKEERKVHGKLQGDMAERLRLIEAADAAKATEYERHMMQRQQMLQETARIQSEKKKSIEDMKNNDRQLAHDLSNFDIITEENEILHDALKELTIQLQQQKAKNAAEKEKKTQKNFDFAITMESILRREVKSLYENYQMHAVQEMDNEAEDAWRENKKLLLELQKRIDASLQLLTDHQRSYEILKRTRIREEVQKQNCKMKQQSAMSLTAYTEKQESLIRKIITVEEKLRSDYEDSRELFETKSRLLEQVHEKTAGLKRSGTLHSKLKEDVVGHVRTMVDSALAFTDRDRVNTVTTLLGETLALPDYDTGSSLHGSDDVVSRHTDSFHDGDIAESFNPEMAWNSSYTSRKINASFSMFKPMA